jgi:hypothetical protein
MRMKLLIFWVGIVFAANGWSQSAMSCSATAQPVLTRVEGVAELVSDIVLECSSGDPTLAGQPVPQVNLQLFFNADVTSKVLATGFSEALLLIDEPGSTGNPVRRVCDTPTTGICPLTGTGSGAGLYDGTPGHPNIFQARQNGVNSLLFLGIPISPAGRTSTRVLRFTNIRLQASSKGPITGAPVPLFGFVATTGPTPLSIDTPTVPVGFVDNGLRFGATPPPAFSQCAPQNPALANNPASNGVSQFSLTFTEGFNSSFRPRTIAAYAGNSVSPAPAPQNVPAAVWYTESGYFDPAFPSILNRGDLATAGLATQGTRLRARFSGVPTGVKLFTQPLLTNGQLVARLVATTPNGDGAFAPVPANGFGIAPVPVNGAGEATLVFEVLRADPAVVESLAAPIYVAYDVPAPSLGSVTVAGALAPLTTVLAASDSAPVPRFVGETPLPGFTITACTGGRMTGGGSVFTANKQRVTHGFTLRCDNGATPNNLQVNWGGSSFHLEALTTAACTDDPGIQPQQPKTLFDTFAGTGTGRLNGVSGATAAWVFTDAGEPGKNDTAQITIKDNMGNQVLTVSGKLDKGNQQAH